ncbi:MAG: hypothetical protein J1E29_00395 [Duncaniella sp.]|nr:hypothetical protein [Duncaniella sp.]
MLANLRYTFLIPLLIGLLLPACSDDEIMAPTDSTEESLLEDYQEGFTLNLSVTLDKMGGVTAVREENPMEEIENYINPEKFRVLFFDYKDRFLFESKSRRVKKLNSSDNFSEWFVSVPFYSSGNDTPYDWDWPSIRDSITNHEFKIAILANRPEVECYPDLINKLEGKEKRFDNSGPNWDRSDMGIKTVFDLHHAQWDPIYTDKGNTNIINGEGLYEYIMGVNTKETDPNRRLLLSSTSCWVDHGANLDDNGIKDSYGNRCWRLPSKDYPIPMYGIQRFNKIDNWVPGTPFNLSSLTSGDLPGYQHRSISLLRSVIKLELLIPKTYNFPDYITLRYSNIYARCEPMNVWSPTDSIWKEDHDNGCEWEAIHRYGALIRTGDPTDAKGSFDKLRQRLSWFYGAWKKKGWTFGSYGAKNVVAETEDLPYPQIFNPVTQRNGIVRCDNRVNLTSMYTDNYYHIVVYTGERNVSDPSNLAKLGDSDSGKPTLIYWMFNIKSGSTNTLYSVPIVDYSKNNPAISGTYSNNNPSNTIGGTNGFEQKVISNALNTNIIPYPLMRNHVYRIVLSAKRGVADSNGCGEIEFSCQDFSSDDISFK